MAMFGLGVDYRRSSFSSSSTLAAERGCTNAMRPPAPIRGLSSRSSTARAFSSAIAASMSYTSRHTWWSSLRLSRNFAITDEGSVGSSSSRCDSPTGRDTVLTFVGRHDVGRLHREAERFEGRRCGLGLRHRDAQVIDLQYAERHLRALSPQEQLPSLRV